MLTDMDVTRRSKLSNRPGDFWLMPEKEPASTPSVLRLRP